MKLGVLFSGGKDSTYAAWLAQKEGYELACFITLHSENKESYMFHTPSISKTKVQADAAEIPLIIQETKGEKEKELEDLKKAIERAQELYGIEGVVTGAVESVYQASRVQKICHELGLECFNPLWQKNQGELLNELLEHDFEIILTGVFAYPLDQTWLGKKIDQNFIGEVMKLNKKIELNPAGEGGEYESFVLNCPLFKKPLAIKDYEDSGEHHSWRRELNVEVAK